MTGNDKVTQDKVTLKDPRDQYPQPEFQKQDQELPGRTEEMKPVPDHGEQSYRGSGKLKGLSALVTGGDSGIGRAVALAYAREGADVAFTYLEEDDDAGETKRLVEEAGSRAVSIKMDQRNRDACYNAIQRCVDELGGLDILVNNAGYQMSYESLMDIPDEEISDIFSANIESFFFLSKGALKHLPAGGSIINTASIKAFEPSPNLAHYSATKAAILNFTLALAAEAIKQGVRVNAVAPGPVWTPLIPSSFPEDKVAGFGGNTLFKRPAQPAELAPVYVFLASPEASYVTGEVYGVTGGRQQI